MKKKIEQGNKEFKQKIHYIINDYIKHLENEGIVENAELKKLHEMHQKTINLLTEYQTQEHFEENTELNHELKRLYEEHQEIVNFLINRQSQSNPLKDVFVNTLALDKFKGKIIKSLANNSFREFYTKNMNEHFTAKNDKSGFWKNGLKYKYLFVLEEKFKKPRIILQLSPKDQDAKTKANFDKIYGTKIAPNAKCKNAKSWEIDIDLANLSRVDEKSIENEISKTLEKIIQWDNNELLQIISQKSKEKPMERIHKWSSELQELTRDILNDPDRMIVWGSLPNKSGVLKKKVFDENGDTYTEDGKVRCDYGFLKLDNAVAHKWIIDLEHGGTETFKSIEDLIDAGWALD